MKAAMIDEKKGGGVKVPCVFVCSAIIKVLPGLLLLHQHVWSPPRVLEVPLERIGQNLCHLCGGRYEDEEMEVKKEVVSD